MSAIQVNGIDWDQGNWPKCGKHGISKADIEYVFKNSPSVYPDLAHSAQEQRSLAIGDNKEGRKILIAFTLRQSAGGYLIRPVSARYMHKKEIKRYEQ